MTGHAHVDPRFGHVYRYHSRSDAHSIALCEFVMQDLLDACPRLAEHAQRGEIAYGINLGFQFPSGKVKNLDLAIGTPVQPVATFDRRPVRVGELISLRLAMEAKSVMTEHGKSQPRVYDELSSSHEIVHQGMQETVAGRDHHRQHLRHVRLAAPAEGPPQDPTGQSTGSRRPPRPWSSTSAGLPIREKLGQVGFDAYATVVSCESRSERSDSVDGPPAPQPGDADHYETFLARVSRFYSERFG